MWYKCRNRLQNFPWVKFTIEKMETKKSKRSLPIRKLKIAFLFTIKPILLNEIFGMIWFELASMLNIEIDEFVNSVLRTSWTCRSSICQMSDWLFFDLPKFPPILSLCLAKCSDGGSINFVMPRHILHRIIFYGAYEKISVRIEKFTVTLWSSSNNSGADCSESHKFCALGPKSESVWAWTRWT